MKKIVPICALLLVLLTFTGCGRITRIWGSSMYNMMMDEMAEAIGDSSLDSDELREITAISWEGALAGFDDLEEEDGDTELIRVYSDDTADIIREIDTKKEINRMFMDMHMSAWKWTDEVPDNLEKEYEFIMYNRSAARFPAINRGSYKEQLRYIIFKNADYVLVDMNRFGKAYFLVPEESLEYLRNAAASAY